MNRRYWATGAISAILVLIWSCFASFLGDFNFLGSLSVQAASPPSNAPLISQEQLSERDAFLAGDVFWAGDVFLAGANPLEQGRVAFAEGRYAEAVAQFRQAAGASVQSGSILEQAQALSYLSLGQQKLGEWSAAERSIAQSLALIHPLEPSREQQLTLGRIFNTQGSLYFAKGQAREALAAWQSAEAAYKAAQDETRQLGSLINQSQAFQSLGFYGRAQTTLEEIHQRLENQPLELRLFGLRSLGNMHWYIGNLDKSEQILRQALQLAPTANQPQQHAALCLSLGNIEQARGDLQRSLHYYKQAANLASGELQFQATLNQFQLSLRLNDQAQARSFISSLKTQLPALPPNRSVLYGATHFANSLTQLAFAEPVNRVTQADTRGQNIARTTHDDLAKAEVLKLEEAPITVQDPESLRLAIQTLTWGMETARELGDVRAEAYARGYLGHLYERSQQWKMAQRLTQMAIAQAESIHAQDIGYQWQWQLARILKAQNQLDPANKAYHNAFDMLQSLRSDLVTAQPDVQFSFRESVEPIYREFVDLLLRPVAPATEPNPEALSLARQVIEALQVAELNNFFQTACLQDQVVPLEEVDRTGAAVLYPIILPDRITLILSLPQQPLRSHSAIVPQNKIQQTLGEFRFNLEKPYVDPLGKALGQQIYDWLIKPIESELEASDIKTLTFVLDGALRNVPMAALYDGEKYLIEKYSIALTPGLQLLDSKPIQLKNKRTLLAGLTEAIGDFSALPNVRGELAAIQEIVSHRILLNDSFTRATLEESVQTSNFPVVHLATHGQFSSNAEDTFILAWDKKVNVQALSSILRGRDRPEPIELLVLSACETASGDSRAALGLAGISVQAGARSTLASLWNVDDESGAFFAEKFYEALLSGKVSRAEALRAAQQALLKDSRYRKPQNWAPYVLVGNWL